MTYLVRDLKNKTLRVAVEDFKFDIALSEDLPNTVEFAGIHVVIKPEVDSFNPQKATAIKVMVFLDLSLSILKTALDQKTKLSSLLRKLRQVPVLV